MERGFDVVSGGTDTHLFLVDLRSRDQTGKDAEDALGRAAIHVNKNTVPGDSRSPFVTSGIRLGTPALTTRGMAESEMALVADLIARVLNSPTDGTIQAVAAEVQGLARGFPLYETAGAAWRRRALPLAPVGAGLHLKSVTYRTAEELLDRIRSLDSPYNERGHLFVLAALEYCQQRRQERGHITGRELAESCRDFALAQFGLTALSVLSYWGLNTTEDIGRVVFELIDLGLLMKQDTDRLEDFCGVFDFDEAFAEGYPWRGVDHAGKEIWPQHRKRGGTMEANNFTACQKCNNGVLIPLSDYGRDGAPITYKAWVCTNPDCGFNLRIDNGEISIGRAIGQSFK
jgi:uncharacterized repeat protein (TIGR04138 family)